MTIEPSPALARTLPGTRIADRYEVRRFVGAGGQGMVFEAEQVHLAKRVALKLLRWTATSGERSPDAPLAEARLLARLRHPHVVSVLDAGVLEDRGTSVPFIVTEWCEGPTLSDFLIERGHAPLRLAEACAIVRPLIDALAHLHALGITHRDIKPSNILLHHGRLDEPRLIDLGIAKPASDEQAPDDGRTASERSNFTAAYAAPEQLVLARTGPWTDVHAIALVFVELVTGKRPYADPNIATALSPARPTPAAFGVDVGPFEPVLMNALALSTRQRPRDASVLAALFDEATKAHDGHGRGHDEPSTQTAPGSARGAATPRHRARAWWSLLLAAPIAGVTWYMLTRPHAPLPRVRSAFARTIAQLPPNPSVEPGRSLDAPCARSEETIRARVSDLGFRVQSVTRHGAQGEGPTMFQYVVVRDVPKVTALWTVEDWTTGSTARSPHELRRRQRDDVESRRIEPFAYGMRAACSAVLDAPRQERPHLFAALATGERFDVIGDTELGPDPARDPEFVRVPLSAAPRTATSLEELSALELESRVADVAWTPVRVMRDGGNVTIHLERASGEGVAITWASLRTRADGASAVAALPRPAAYALSEHVAVWAHGYGNQRQSSASLEVLQAVLAKLNVVIQAAP